MFSKITNGFFLKTYNILVDWKWDRRTFLEKTSILNFSTYSNEKFNYFGYTFSCALFKIEKPFDITFNYVNEKLVSVNISQSFVENNIEERYKYMQGVLEFELGKPISFSINKKHEVKSIWKIQNIKIIHVIIDRFGLEQFLEIKPV